MLLKRIKLPWQSLVNWRIILMSLIFLIIIPILIWTFTFIDRSTFSAGNKYITPPMMMVGLMYPIILWPFVIMCWMYNSREYCVLVNSHNKKSNALLHLIFLIKMMGLSLIVVPIAILLEFAIFLSLCMGMRALDSNHYLLECTQWILSTHYSSSGDYHAYWTIMMFVLSIIPYICISTCVGMIAYLVFHKSQMWGMIALVLCTFMILLLSDALLYPWKMATSSPWFIVGYFIPQRSCAYSIFFSQSCNNISAFLFDFPYSHNVVWNGIQQTLPISYMWLIVLFCITILTLFWKQHHCGKRH